MSSTPRWTTRQVICLITWLATFALSVGIYVPRIIKGFDKANAVCTLPGVRDMLVAWMHPPNWLALFLGVITVFFARPILQRAASRHPQVDDYKWVVAMVVAALVVTILAIGC